VYAWLKSGTYLLRENEENPLVISQRINYIALNEINEIKD
jgi:hypothetical protein